MDIERALVNKVVQNGAVEQTIAQSIEPHHFEDEDAKLVYEIMVEHVRQYKIPPSLDVLKREIAAHEKKTKSKVDFHFEVSQDALQYLIDKFIGLIKFRATTTAVRELAAKTDDQDNWISLDLDALEIARTLALTVPSSQIGRLSDVQQRIDEYERRKAEGNAWGIKTGINALDLLTMGIQPHEMVTIAGWMGLGKSTLAQIFMFNAYKEGKRPLIFSMEMEAEALFRKWDAMAADLSFQALKAMELGEGDMEKWERWGEKASAAKGERDIIVIDDVARPTVDSVFAETIRHKPDLVCVDYIGLMDAPSNLGTIWERQTYCTKGLKHSARTLKVPHVVVAQTNRDDSGKGAELGNIAGSLSAGRDSDQVYGLYQDETMREDERMSVKLLKNRDGPQGEAILKWNPSEMIFRELDSSDWFTNTKNEEFQT